jgi:uncharacterized protein (TIGR02646 family)
MQRQMRWQRLYLKMIKIDRTRVSEPTSLMLHGLRWGQELCDLRRAWHAGGCVGERPDALKSRYRSESVTAALESLFGKKCCYFEQKAERYDIEHFRPQSLYPLLAYRWFNLLVACQTCNQNHKKDQFPVGPDGNQVTEDSVDPASRDENDEALLLDPCDLDPINHLTFREGRALGITQKGRTTVRVCQLNRDFLVESRQEYLVAIRTIVLAYHRAKQKNDTYQVVNQGANLERLSRDQARFAGMVRRELAQLGYDWRTL